MHDLDKVLVLVALASSALLIAQSSERLFAGIAFLAAGVEALLVFKLMTLSVASLRVDVILPALLVIGGGIAWSRAAAKSHVTAATLITMIGLLQLVVALRVLQ